MLNVSPKFNESYRASQPEPDQSTDTVVAIDRNGNHFEYHLRDLYPDENSYMYIANQSKLFRESLPELIDKHGGHYVVFEDGKVIDEDENEDVLLERMWETDFIKQRMGADGHGIYCHFVPTRLTTS
jgi:hypothetical protein